MSIELLPSNRPPSRFYRGGARIGRFRGEAVDATHEPEDWVGSATTIAGEAQLGLSSLGDGRRVRDAIAADPEHWLGPDHVATFGADPMLLVKLLDAGQRLPVHAHPDGDFAARHLGTAHGKAEAWYILRGGTVHVGLTRDVSVEEVRALVESQDTGRMLELLHEVPVVPGDVVFVPPGTLHAIGEGVFLLEVQEPEDLSILLEWSGFDLDGPADGHLGLGFDIALEAVDRRGRSAEEVDAWRRSAPGRPSVLPEAADEYFRIERPRRPAILEPGFAIAVVTEGELRVGELTAPRGSTLLIPFAAGAVEVSGDGELLVCRPPRP